MCLFGEKSSAVFEALATLDHEHTSRNILLSGIYQHTHTRMKKISNNKLFTKKLGVEFLGLFPKVCNVGTLGEPFGKHFAWLY